MIASLRTVRARLRAAWRWVREKLERRPRSTPGQRDQARETEVSLGLMAAAASAGADMTPEQQIFLGQSEHGMRERLSVLLRIPHRSLDQEREKLSIEGWLRRTAPDVTAPRGFAALGAANPFLALASSPMTWAVAFGLLLTSCSGIQTWRLNNAKAGERAARADLAMTERALGEARATQERLANAVREADAQTQQTAVSIEAERARRLRAEREARRIRDAVEQARNGGPIDYGFGGVRDAGSDAPGPGDHNAADRNPG